MKRHIPSLRARRFYSAVLRWSEKQEVQSTSPVHFLSKAAKQQFFFAQGGEAAVFLRSGADDPVILLSESGEYDGTIEVDGTSTYIGVWGDQAEGTVSIEIE